MKSLDQKRVPAISFADAAEAALDNAEHYKKIGDRQLANGLNVLADKSFAKAERHILRAQRLIAAISRG